MLSKAEREFEYCRARTLLAGVAGHPDDEVCGKPADYRILIYRNPAKKGEFVGRGQGGVRADRYNYVCGGCLTAVVEGLRDDGEMAEINQRFHESFNKETPHEDAR
jgi:hypothetical protein